MAHGLFLTNHALPGRRDELIEVWQRHMPAAVEANDGHAAYVFTVPHDNPDTVVVYQQYASAEAAAEFVSTPGYRAYIEESASLLAGPPDMVTVVPLWSKNVGLSPA